MNLKEKSTHKLKTALQRSPKQQEQMGTFFKCEKKTTKNSRKMAPCSSPGVPKDRRSQIDLKK